MRTIKEMVENGQKVKFSHYRDGQLWYKTECDFEFPVPLVREVDEKDVSSLVDVKSVPLLLNQIKNIGAKLDAGIGTATFMAEDKAMLFMRYIRKHVEFLEKSKANPDEVLEDPPLKIKLVVP